jgi:CRISPR-associated protein Csm2
MNSHDNHNSYAHKPNRNNYDSSTVRTITVPEFNSPELLGADALKLAEDVAKDTKLTTSQIRNFYGEVKSIERLLDTNEKRWDELYNRIKLLKAKAIYNKNRDNNTRRDFGPFAEFLSISIDRIKIDENGIKNFRIFCQLFEAFVGYSTEYVRER